MSSTTPTCEDPIVGEIEKKDECPAQQPSHQEEPTKQKNEIEKKEPESSKDARKLQVKPKSPMVVHSDLQEEEAQSKAEQATSSASAAASSASVSAVAPLTTAQQRKQQEEYVANYRLAVQLQEQVMRMYPNFNVTEKQLNSIAARLLGQNGVKTAVTSLYIPLEPHFAVSPAPAPVQVLAPVDLPPSPAPDQSKKDLVPEEEEEDQIQKKKTKLEVRDE